MFYKYKVTLYNTYDDKEEVEEGLVYAKNYPSAADSIITDYGKDHVIDMYLIEIYDDVDGSCITKNELQSVFFEETN